MIHQLSAPAENCLLLVHRLTEQREAVTTSRLARGLGVTDSTVTSMIQKLARLKLLNYKPRKEISLSKKGGELSLQMIRRHRLIETYLYEKLGYAWDEVHAEAEKLEHSVSEKFVDAIASALGYPTHDPHGDPIPDSDGTVENRNLIRLSDAVAGVRGVVARVIDNRSETLVYLAGLELKPGVEIKLVAVPDYDSVVTLRVNSKTVSLGKQLASQILIEKIESP